MPSETFSTEPEGTTSGLLTEPGLPPNDDTETDEATRQAYLEDWNAVPDPTADGKSGEVDNDMKPDLETDPQDLDHDDGEDEDEHDKEGTEGDIGSMCKVKDLFASSASGCSCCRSWEDEKPFRDNEEEVRKKIDGRKKFAVIRRREPHGEMGLWRTHSILINSPLIRASLAEVFGGYPGLDLSDVELSFSPPFYPFVHRWEKLAEVMENAQDPTTKAHLQLLRIVLQPETKELFEKCVQIRKTGHVSYANLQLAYVPGELVLEDRFGERHSDGDIRAGILYEMDSGKDSMEFWIKMVDWNGRELGVDTIGWEICEFKGSRKIADLPVSPLRVHDDRQSIQQRLIERGRKIESLTGKHFRQYYGAAITKASDIERMMGERRSITKELDERIIIDAKGYHTFQDRDLPDLDPLKRLEEWYVPSGSGVASVSPQQDAGSPRPEREAEDESRIENTPEKTGTGRKLTDFECMLANPRLFGFAMESKVWCTFNFHNLRHIKWNENALDKLVMRESEKRLLIALMPSSSQRNGEAFDDIIRGKGRGTTLLFCGPTGVGKTLTAECIAEHLKRPLYRVGVDELGVSASAVEGSLTRVLRRCNRWEAVLLIDEADVFLQARSHNDLERNELVAVFLRIVEYYEGIMLLTTNRIASIDAAFESRIDITLPFESLDEEGRAQVWRNFLEQSGSLTVEVNDDDIKELAKLNLNGRQIKSAAKTGFVLAAKEGQPLTLGHLMTVVNIRLRSTELFM